MSAVERPLLAIVGQTAVGKSALALRLARRFEGEVVSADSRQVYRYMDLGTAKPSPEERSSVPHHLIDIIDPDDDYSLSLFLRHATEAIEDVHSRARLPILTGGTGQYVWGLLEGWQVPECPPDAALRESLQKRARLHGPAALHQELAGLDPEAARRIDARNLRRVIRALEVRHSSPDHRGDKPRRIAPPYQAKLVGLTLNRVALYQRIDSRVHKLIESGWTDEVRTLLERGYGPELPSMSSLGYGELIQHLKNDVSLNAAVERIKTRTHKLARHQHAWFRLTDPRIHWFDVSNGLGPVEAEVAGWLDLGG